VKKVDRRFQPAAEVKFPHPNPIWCKPLLLHLEPEVWRVRNNEKKTPRQGVIISSKEDHKKYIALSPHTPFS